MGGSRSIKNPKNQTRSHIDRLVSASLANDQGFFLRSPATSLARDDDSFFFCFACPSPSSRFRLCCECEWRRRGEWMAPPLDVAWDDWNAVVAGEAVTWAATSVGMTGR